MWFGENIKQSIDDLRLHHQLGPMVLYAEQNYPSVRKAYRVEPARAETKKSADEAPKAAETMKQEPARNASLFDIGPVTAAAPVPASDTDEDEEILAEIAEDEAADEADDIDEAA